MPTPLLLREELEGKDSHAEHIALREATATSSDGSEHASPDSSMLPSISRISRWKEELLMATSDWHWYAEAGQTSQGGTSVTSPEHSDPTRLVASSAEAQAQAQAQGPAPGAAPCCSGNGRHLEVAGALNGEMSQLFTEEWQECMEPRNLSRFPSNALQSRATARSEEPAASPPTPSFPSVPPNTADSNILPSDVFTQGLVAPIAACRAEGPFSASDEEEADWENRRKTSGLVARMVSYKNGEQMRHDFTLRPCINPKPSGAIVLDVCPLGHAEKAGVRSGDRLVLVNGDKNVSGLTMRDLVKKVEDSKALSKLVFMSYIGRANAEVRLLPNPQETKAGYSTRTDKVLAAAKAKFVFQEERVFDEHTASLSLGVQAHPMASPREMFSLEPMEAARLVLRAKSQAQEKLLPKTELLTPGSPSSDTVSPMSRDVDALLQTEQFSDEIATPMRMLSNPYREGSTFSPTESGQLDAAVGPKAGFADNGIEDMHSEDGEEENILEDQGGTTDVLTDSVIYTATA
eukprot:TRINITY_DN110958_c0_g1_i1.p1 TRINITY_DN110958_c0_g1~~TRINITY_DN110958_c0_g1_i1.p1  ORF type:complete len:535 (+),score=101.87 TRINITY_DN110958_c0_g1_i1:51-1607(+)